MMPRRVLLEINLVDDPFHELLLPHGEQQQQLVDEGEQMADTWELNWTTLVSS